MWLAELMPDVEIRDNTEEQRFEALVDGGVVGYARYQLSSGVITFLHTEVDPSYEGQGIGSTLARRALDQVRDDGELKMRLLCPFFRSYVARHDEYADLVLP
jgi:predicted GNAT family acetyltransferase